MANLHVKKPGLLTTIQDLGRYGYQQFGVAVAGAMDQESLEIANLLVGNKRDAAVLEMNVLGGTFLFDDQRKIAITGADMSAQINGEAIPSYQTIQVYEGDELSFQAAQEGLRTYLAIQGAFDIEPVLGSFSTYTRGNMGGFDGRALEAEDQIPLGKLVEEEDASQNFYRLDPEKRPDFLKQRKVRAVLGPQADSFDEKAIQDFFSKEYEISQQADRMGYRLKGEPIEHKDGADIISDGILFGSVQVSGDGLPTIMMADHQTTGGYAKIATVIQSDLCALAQMGPKAKIGFEEISPAQAVENYRKWRQDLDQITTYFIEIDENEREEMMAKDMDVKAIGELMHYFADSGIGELSLDVDDLHLSLKKNKAGTKAGDQQVLKKTKKREEEKQEMEDNDYYKVQAPISGVCYEAPNPEDDPFIQVGDHVEEGQTLLIIEVMKMMNEIKAPVSGVVREIFFENEKNVDQDTVLLSIEED